MSSLQVDIVLLEDVCVVTFILIIAILAQFVYIVDKQVLDLVAAALLLEVANVLNQVIHTANSLWLEGHHVIAYASFLVQKKHKVIPHIGGFNLLVEVTFSNII